MRSLDKFYKYLENRESGEPAPAVRGAEAAKAARTESRYIIRNGVTVAVSREDTATAQSVPVSAAEEETILLEDQSIVPETPTVTVPLPDSGAIWRGLPENVRRLAQLSADLMPEATPQAPERRQLIERLLNPLLSLEDTARLLGVCTATVRRYANKGVLPHQRTIGQQRRFLLSDVLALLESRKPAPEAAALISEKKP